ncbi:MAG: hypothetical protein H7336_15065 [Bacteriovorax sp.]|nr:hypothetical protein [Bacteriovorax sp.]
MKFSKKIYTVLFGSLLTTIFISSASATDNCVQCGSKNVPGAPNLPMNGLDKVALMVGQSEKPTYSFIDYQASYCMKFVQIEKNELNQMIRDLKETPYSVDDYFQKAGCKPEKAGGVKSPILHLTAEAPCSRVEYPQIIYKYYTVKRKDPKLWIEAVNAKNTLGETYLDYIESLNKQNDFNTVATKECASQLIAFACKTGATYSKVKNKTCPTDI